MSGRGAAVAAVTPPGAIAVMSMDDSIAAAPRLVANVMRASRRLLAWAHGEPSLMDRRRWDALTAAERRECLDASKRKALA